MHCPCCSTVLPGKHYWHFYWSKKPVECPTCGKNLIREQQSFIKANISGALPLFFGLIPNILVKIFFSELYVELPALIILIPLGGGFIGILIHVWYVFSKLQIIEQQ